MELVEKLVTMNGAQSLTDKLKEFKTPAVRKATFQAVALFSFMQICGLNSIIMYMEIILTNAKFNLFKPCGRNFLLLLASAGTTISLLGLMSHYLMMDAGMDVTDIQWLPLVSIFLYMIAYYIGLMPVPSTILNLPAPMLDSMGEAYVYLVYAILSALLAPYTLLFMMETKGKSWQEIQDKLTRK
ncbi:facilitated trehalose transporter Tret1-like [Nasonia vitripennis]|uniref:Uncharacterized protein n=1 Tax=Nasonia vitripennis TaxID=7425 RepID=A0A7M7QEI2_NASVI|nr:facilitated trehalose transporter Tret1-like [Nasonia vitripennis]